MDARRTTWEVAIRLAITLSAAACLMAIGLESLGVSQPAIVLTVIVVGFVTSWIRTGQVVRSFDRPRSHRMVTIPVHDLRHPVA